MPESRPRRVPPRRRWVKIAAPDQACGHSSRPVAHGTWPRPRPLSGEGNVLSGRAIADLLKRDRRIASAHARPVGDSHHRISGHVCRVLVRVPGSRQTRPGTSGLIASAALVLTLAVLGWWATHEPAPPAAHVPAPTTATGDRSHAVAANTGVIISGDMHNPVINFTGVRHDTSSAAAPPREAMVHPLVAADVPRQPVVTSAEPPASSPPPVNISDKRIFVGPGVTYEYLFALYDGKMDVQAQTTADLYIGKWMPISRPLTNVGPWNSKHAYSTVTLALEQAHVLQARYVLFWLSDRSQFDRVSVRTPGDLITIQGRIKAISRQGIELEDCELVGERPQVSV